MPKAIWNGVVLAESDACRIVEGHYYFPPEAVKPDYCGGMNPHEHIRGLSFSRSGIRSRQAAAIIKNSYDFRY